MQENLGLLPELSDALNTLKQAESDFLNTHLNEEEKKSESILQQSPTELRSKVLHFVNKKFLSYVYFLEVSDPETYSSLAALFREIVKTNNSRVKHRKSLNLKTRKPRKDKEKNDEKLDNVE